MMHGHTLVRVTVADQGKTQARAGGSDESVYSLSSHNPKEIADILLRPGGSASTRTFRAIWARKAVGRVVKVGAGVDESLVGRRVLVLPTFEYGTWAQETVVPASRLIPVREDLDALQLAMMPVTAATAYALLHDYVAGASLRMLLEGTGDPARSPSWSASSTRRAAWSRLPPRPVRRPSFPSPTLIYRGISLRSFYIPGWLGDTPRERLEEIYGELAELVAQA
jgi:hypothetical protein